MSWSVADLNPKNVQSEIYDIVWYKSDCGLEKFTEFERLSAAMVGEKEIDDISAEEAAKIDTDKMKPVILWLFQNALCDKKGEPPIESGQDIVDSIEKVSALTVINLTREFGDIVRGNFAKKKSENLPQSS